MCIRDRTPFASVETTAELAEVSKAVAKAWAPEYEVALARLVNSYYSPHDEFGVELWNQITDSDGGVDWLTSVASVGGEIELPPKIAEAIVARGYVAGV